MRADRSHLGDLGGAAPRPGAGAHRGGAAERAERERPARRTAREGHQTPRSSGADLPEYQPARPRSTGASAARRDRAPARPAPTAPGVRGALGVLGVFLLTLAGAGADSFVGVGLRTFTLIALVGGTAVAAATVRRRDLGTIVVAPPLIFVGVALVNIVLAPSATFSLPTVATLLIRGFPAMAIAVVAGLALTIVRLVARR